MDKKEETNSANARAQQLSILKTVEEKIKKSKKPKNGDDKRTKTHTQKIGGVKLTTIDLPKGSTAFQQVLEEIHTEMEEEKNMRVDGDPKGGISGHIVKGGNGNNDHGRHHVPAGGASSNFYRTQSVSGGYSGAFARNKSRKMLLKTKSSREILFEKLDIIT